MSTSNELIGISEYKVVDGSKIAKTTLGSCVGLILHDPKRKVSGIAHIMLPKQVNGDSSVGKYADTAIPALFDALGARGCGKPDLKAYVVGGASMFHFASDKVVQGIGEQNVEAVKSILAQERVSIVFEDVGGQRGRTVLFDTANDRIEVQTLKSVKELTR